MYESVTKYRQFSVGSCKGDRSSTEEPNGAHAAAEHKPSFCLSEPDAGGEYIDIIEQDEVQESGVGLKPGGGGWKGILGWLGIQFGRGAKRRESAPGREEQMDISKSCKGERSSTDEPKGAHAGVERKPSAPKDGQDEEAFYETLTKKPELDELTGGGRSSVQEPVKCTPIDEKTICTYESITQYRKSLDGGSKGDRSSTEEPKGAHTPAEHKSSFCISEADAGGDYTDIIEEDEDLESGVALKHGRGGMKGLLGWLGIKFGRGAKRKESTPRMEEPKEISKRNEGEGCQIRSEDSQEGAYHVLRHPLLKKPKEFMPQKPSGANYDHVDPHYDQCERK
jgi:hypothetical protein